MKKKDVVFLTIFSIIGFACLQIPFTKLVGSTVSFTLFDFFAPIAGAFIGPFYGILSVFLVEIVNIAFHHTPMTIGTIIRLFPMLFAVYYFAIASKKHANSKFILVVPLISIALFILHPIGRLVWYFSLFWTIPLIAYLKKDMLLFRSLGATFTAHAVGGAMWIWAISLTPEMWRNLIPTVIAERLLFAVGISISYILVKRALSFLIKKRILPTLDALDYST